MILLDISLMPLANIRQAVFHYSKETKDSTGSVSAKKHAHFTQILAIQLAAEQQRGLPS
jgi:N-terminal acetyltransferase B complex non-catalytic subunit